MSTDTTTQPSMEGYAQEITRSLLQGLQSGDGDVGRLVTSVSSAVPSPTLSLVPEMAAAAPTGGAPASTGAGGDQQRFLGSLFASAVPILLETVPPLLEAIQGRRRELGLPEQRDTDAVQRDFASIFNGLLGPVLQALPQIVQQFAGQRDLEPAKSQEEVQERFLFPLLATLIPAAVQALPGIIGAVSGQNRDLPGSSDRETLERFLPSVLNGIVGGCFQQLPQLLQAFSPQTSRDLVPASTGAGGDQQRFFGSIFATTVPILLNAVPPLLEAIQGRRRELGLPEQRDTDAAQRDFGAIFSGLLGPVLQALPQIVQQFAGQRDLPSNSEEEAQQRFIFPLLATLIPAAVQALPGIIGAVSGQNRDLPGSSDRETVERFLPPLLGGLITSCFQQLPQLLQAFAPQTSRDLEPADGGAGTATTAPAGTTPATTTPATTTPSSGAPVPGIGGGDQQRFLGGLFSAVLPVLVNTVPPLLQAIAGQRRAMGLPEVRDVEQQQRDFGAVLSGLLGPVMQALPQILQQFAGQRDLEPPATDEEVQQRFLFPLLTTLIPVVAQAVPSIISSLSGQRDLDPGLVSVTDKEVAQRFFGPLIGQLAGGLVQQLPQLISLLTNRPREAILNHVNFTGQWMPDGDVIRAVETDLGDPTVIEFGLEQPVGTWFKGLELWVAGTKVQGVGVQDNNRVSETIRVPVHQVAGAGYLKFVKAKMFGIHTGVYTLAALEQKAGKRVVYHWEHS